MPLSAAAPTSVVSATLCGGMGWELIWLTKTEWKLLFGVWAGSWLGTVGTATQGNLLLHTWLIALGLLPHGVTKPVCGQLLISQHLKPSNLLLWEKGKGMHATELTRLDSILEAFSTLSPNPSG